MHKEVISGHSEKTAVCNTREESSPEIGHDGILISDFQPSELRENKFLLFKPYSLRFFLLWQPKQTNTGISVVSYLERIVNHL
jgi:hypothetical protein